MADSKECCGDLIFKVHVQHGKSDNDEESNSLYYEKTTDRAFPPYKATDGSVGYDLCSAEDEVVPTFGRTTIHTDLAFSFPKGTYGRIAGRSGLASKEGIIVGAGVIDRDYT